jgi:dipeptidyl aminopeptidase/acylaminoacyl peptidase
VTGLRARLAVFAVVVAVLATVAVSYTGYALHRDRARIAAGERVRPAVGAVRLTGGGGPRLVFRDTALGPGFGHLASVGLAGGRHRGRTTGVRTTAVRTTGVRTTAVRTTGIRTAGPRAVDSRSCERSYAAAGRLLCLAGSGGLILRHYADLYDAGGHRFQRIRLPGLPSRARLSADGRMAAWTAFVYGDSYTSIGFSTRTGILDTRTGRYVPSLEQFTTYRDGRVFAPTDRNFWGVSFLPDDNTFYATLGSTSQGGTFLVRGDFRAGRMTVLTRNVECPSLSPDGTRLAFKKKVSDDPSRPWRLYVLDLATLRETPLADTRSVDDQADWLDDRTVGYALPHGGGTFDIWQQPADGHGRPRLLLRGADSPSVIG